MGFDVKKDIKFSMSMTGADAVKAASKGVQDGFWDTDRAVKAATAGLAGLAGFAGYEAFKSMIMGITEANGKLHDLSLTTGISVAALAQFKAVGAFTETAIEDIAAASLKLSKNLASSNEESKGTAQAIKALGLDFDAFKKLNPDEQMLKVAKAMAEFGEGSGKSAAAMMLFGKQGAAMLPFLGDLAESADKVTAALTDQQKEAKALQAAMADAFGDNLTAIRKNSDAWKKDLALGLLPAMYEVSQVFLDMAGGTGGLKAKIKELAADGTLAEWARNAVNLFSLIADVVQVLYRIVETFVKFFTATMAALVTGLDAVLGPDGALAKALKGDFSGSFEALKSGFRQVGAIGSAAATDISATWSAPTLGQQFRDRMGDIKNVGVAAKEVKPQLDLSEPLLKTAGAAKAQKDEYAQLNTKIAELILKQVAEIDSGEKLTEVDKLIILAKKQRTGVELESALASLAVAKANEDVIETTKRRMKADEDAAKARIANLTATDKETEKLIEQATQQAAVNATLATGVDVTKQLEVAKLRDAAASIERRAILLLDKDLDEAQFDAFKRQAEALKSLADAKEKGIGLEAAKEANKEWTKVAEQIGQGLTDSLYRAFEAGNGFFSTLWKGIMNTFKTTVLRLVVDTVMSPVNALIGSVLGGASSLATAGGAAQAVGGIGQAAGGIGSIGSMIGGVGASLGAFGTAAGYGASALFGGTGLTALSGGASMIGAGSVASGLGMIAGVLGPLAIGVGLLMAFAKSLPGGTPHQGSVVTTDASGTYTGGSDPYRILNNFNDKTDTALKGLTGGAVGLLNMLSSSFGGAANFGATAKFAADGQDASLGAFAIQQGGADLAQIGQFSGWSNAKSYASDPKAAFEAFGADVGTVVRTAIDAINLPQWAATALASLGADPGIDKLTEAAKGIALTATALGNLSTTLTPMGGVFERLGKLSDDAKFKLAGMVGGIDALIAKSQSFVQAYYTQDEQASISARSILEQVQRAGVDSATYEKIAGLTDKTGLRALLESIDPAGAKGLDLTALALNIAGPFAALAESMGGLTLGELAATAIEPVVLKLLAKAEEDAAASDVAQETANATAELAATTADATKATAESMAAAAEVLKEIAANTAADVTATADGLSKVIAALASIETRLAAIETEAKLASAAPAEG